MTEEKKTTKSKEIKLPKGKYIEAVGRRKTSVARVRLYKKGEGLLVINNEKASKYFSEDKISTIKQPLKATGCQKDVDISVVVKGGGLMGQAEATRHGIARVLIKFDEGYTQLIKTNGWLSRDARKKERKKPGLKKARRAPQWSKR